MKRIICWWHGHRPDYKRSAWNGDYYPVPCSRCGASDTSYSDQVGDTRHNRTKEWVHYWLFRRWIPAKCQDCGRRSMCDECRDVPF